MFVSFRVISWIDSSSQQQKAIHETTRKSTEK